MALGNSSHTGIDDQDYVGVVIAWEWPDAFDGVAVADLRKAQGAVATGGPWRESPQAKDWVGYAIAKALGLDASSKTGKAKVLAILKTWITNGMFVVVEGLDDNRQKRSFIEVGEAAKD